MSFTAAIIRTPFEDVYERNKRRVNQIIHYLKVQTVNNISGNVARSDEIQTEQGP